MSASRIEKLYSFRDNHPNGGFEWTGYDLSDAIEIAKSDASFAASMAWMAPDTPITPRSRYNFACEDYVKRVVVEELGVLAQISGTSKSKYGQLAYTMKGVCPFHRRVHSHQHWVLCEGRPGQPTFARCMKPLKRFTQTVHYPTKNVGDLELVEPLEKYKDRPFDYFILL